MEKASKSKKILGIILMVFYAVVGTIALIFANKNYDKETISILIGGCMILTSLPQFYEYIKENGHREINIYSSYVSLGIISIAIGVAFILADVSVAQMCFIWGLFDVIRGSLELKYVIPELKHNKLEFFTVAAIAIDIVLGILLCAHLEEGIQLHLIFLAVSYYMDLIKSILDVAINRKK